MPGATQEVLSPVDMNYASTELDEKKKDIIQTYDKMWNFKESGSLLFNSCLPSSP